MVRDELGSASINAGQGTGRGGGKCAGSQLADAAAAKLRASGLVALAVPVSCRTEAPEGCGVHVAELATPGVDLEAVAVLQLLQEPASAGEGYFAFPVALHLEDKPRARVVFAYVCPAEDLLVPLTRWVLRSPRAAVTVLAAPRAPPNSKPAPVLIYPGDVRELCSEAVPAPEAVEAVEVDDAKVGQRLQQALERLWHAELRARQLQPEARQGTPGPLARSARLQHRVTAGGRVVCTGFSVASPEAALLAETPRPRRGEELLPLAADWTQLELQLQGLLAAQQAQSAGANPGKARRGSRQTKQLTRQRGSQPSGKGRGAPRQAEQGAARGASAEQGRSPSSEEEPGEPEEAEEEPEAEGRAEELQQPTARALAVAANDGASEDHGNDDCATAAASCGVQLRAEQQAASSSRSEQAVMGPSSGGGAGGTHCDAELAPSRASSRSGCRSSKGSARAQSSDRQGSSERSDGVPSRSLSPTSRDDQRGRRAAGSECSRAHRRRCPGPRARPGEQPGAAFRDPLTEEAAATAAEAAQEEDVDGVGSRQRDCPQGAASLLSRRPKSKSWADMSEEDDEDDVDCFFFESRALRSQLASQLEDGTSRGRETSWLEVGAALEALPGKVSEAISDAIQQATGVEAHIPARRVEVPMSQRCSSTMAVESSDHHGMLEGSAWMPENPELGQWYELQLEQERRICGMVLKGSAEHAAWVEVVKLKTLDSEGNWADVGGGNLFQACRDAETAVEVPIDPVSAIAVRIYPVVWHGRIALHTALLEPASKLSLEAGVTASFRDDAGMATAAMVSSELGALHDLGRSLSSREVNCTSIADLVGQLYAVPSQVASAAQRLEARVVEAWREKARADAALQSARQWVDTIPEELPLVVSARAQAAAMDQVSAALALLEELQQVTASSIAESVLRAKVIQARSPSETEQLRTGLGKLVASRGGSSVTLETVPEGESSEDGEGDVGWTDAAEYHGCSKDRNVWRQKRLPKTQQMPARAQNPEFWLDVFLQHHAFRIGGADNSVIWETQQGDPRPAGFEYTVYARAGQEALQHGSGTAGEVVQLQGLAQNRAVFVSVALGETKVAAALAPLRQLDHWGVMHAPTRAVTAVFAIAGEKGKGCLALAVGDGTNGEPQLMTGGASWDHETAHRQWSVMKRGPGYSVRHLRGKELATDRTRVVLAERGDTWEFRPVGSGAHHLAVYLVSGPGAVSTLPGGGLVFSTDRALWVEWLVFEQTHYELSSADLVSLPPHRPEPDVGGVFRAAEAWRQARSCAQRSSKAPGSLETRADQQPG